MGDESFFDISALQPSRNVISLPWMAQSQANCVQRQQTKTINQTSNINDGQNPSGLFRYLYLKRKHWLVKHTVFKGKQPAEQNFS